MDIRKTAVFISLTLLLIQATPACGQQDTAAPEKVVQDTAATEEMVQDTTATGQVVTAALQQLNQTIYYDPSYQRLAYPGGDVPLDRGVCTDVVVRALRKAGVDLQVLVHNDMKAAFSAYPQQWGLTRPDRNIDHRRVPNLMTFFERTNRALPLSHDPIAYQPGDIVAWRLPNGRLHVGIVSNVHAPDVQRYLMVHNIGAGAKLEDILFVFDVIGHYRYF